MKTRVIDRATRNGISTELVEKMVGKTVIVYREETKEVWGGTSSRRTINYASYEEYCDARDAGTLEWKGWE